MIEQLEMWKIYLYYILDHPLLISTFIASFILSAMFFLLFKKVSSLKKKVNFLALHIIFLFFPFIFSAVFWRCMMPVLTCSPMMLMIFAPISAIIATLLGFSLLPFIYRWSYKNNPITNGYIREFVKRHSNILKVKEPEVYSINDIRPFAYSITNLRPSIFVSAGLCELLTKKEMEAVLLHELHHHKNKAYFWKFSSNALRLFTPVAAFANVSISIEKEEVEADNYAISVQKTDRYLISAKAKTGKYHCLQQNF